MTMQTKRGFTLVELMVALVMLMAVGGALYGVLVSQQRLGRAQAAQASLQSNVRTGVALLAQEFRSLATAPTGSDVLAMGANSLTYRAMRGSGVACQVTSTQVRLLSTPFYGYRQPQAGRDSLLLFVEGNPNLATDDRWLALPITGVTTGSTCGAAAAIALTTTINIVATPLSQIVLWAPARTFEVMRVELYGSGGKNWLGARSVSAGETIQPVLGPITGSGLALAYFDSVGAATTNPRRLRRIQIAIHGITDQPIRVNGFQQAALVQDSLVTQVDLRNAPRF